MELTRVEVVLFMAFKLKYTEEAIKRWIKEGRGSGEFENYEPWIRTRNVPSIGWKSRTPGVKINRGFELLSQNELLYLLLCEWGPKVIDIREQYPLLPRASTQLIANSLGIKYPQVKETNVDIVLTTDFLLTCQSGKKTYYLARTIKSNSDLEKRKYSDMDISFIGDIETDKDSEEIVNSAVLTLVTEKQTLIRTLDFTLRANGAIKYIKQSQIELIADKAIREVENGWYGDHGMICATLTKAFLDEEARLKQHKKQKNGRTKKTAVLESEDLRNISTTAKENGLSLLEELIASLRLIAIRI